jgi:hypothetical protein
MTSNLRECHGHDSPIRMGFGGEPTETRANLESSKTGPRAALDTPLHGYHGRHNLAARWIRSSKQMPKQTYCEP